MSSCARYSLCDSKQSSAQHACKHRVVPYQPPGVERLCGVMSALRAKPALCDTDNVALLQHGYALV